MFRKPGSAERSGGASATSPGPALSASWQSTAEFAVGLQSATAALLIVKLNATIGLTESAWAITACTYAISGSASATTDRVKRRILGTAIGVPLGLACLPLATTAPLVVWAAAALAMVIYAMALPERYDVACGAVAFTLIVTLAVSEDHSIPLLASRAWETFLGGVLGLVVETLLLPLRTSNVIVFRVSV